MTALSSKYPEPRDAIVIIDVQQIDRWLDLPDTLRVTAVTCDPLSPNILVRVAGDVLPPRPINGYPPHLGVATVVYEDGTQETLWGEAARSLNERHEAGR